MSGHLTNPTPDTQTEPDPLHHHAVASSREVLPGRSSAWSLTLKSNWLVQQQQQQQLALKEGVNSISKEIATWEIRAGMRDETRAATEVELATGNSKRAVSEVDVGTDLQWTRSYHRCTLEKRSEYSRNRKSENRFDQNLHSRRPGERQDDIQ